MAPAKPAVVGRSALTCQPPANQRNWSCARSIAASRVGVPADRDLADRAGGLADRGRAGGRRSRPRSGRRRGSTAIRWSASGANRSTDLSPLTATPMSTPCVGQVPDPWRSRRGSGRRRTVTSSPVCSSRMISIASTSMSCRASIARPALADHVLVEVLPGAEAEREAPVGEDLQRRGLLRDDRRVVAQGRAGHVGHQLDPLGRLGDRAEHRPGVRRVPLRREPREVVVARHLEVEPDLLGCDGVPDQLLRAALLGHQGVAEIASCFEPRRGRGCPAHPISRCGAPPAARRPGCRSPRSRALSCSAR